MKTLRQAEDAIRLKFTAKGFKGTLTYDPAKVIENDRWWYIPFRWIGCDGFIVSKSDFHVNWLGSGVKLEHCLWAHDHGIDDELVDFTFSPETDLKLAERLLSRFKHLHPDAKGVLPQYPVYYRDSELRSALASQFPTFKHHCLWWAISSLFQAYEQEGLRFTCVRSITT